MSDIFLSYASADRERIQPLIQALTQHGWTVWWDRRIPPGRVYAQVIHEALSDARCVIVVWSRAAVVSDWVGEEADEGRKRGILVPVAIDHVVPPFGFGRIEVAQLMDW
jgi:hypothetical protein